MLNPFRRLMEVLARSGECELRQQIQFLKAENEIFLARVPKAVRTTAEERARLVKLGRPLGNAIKELITIVSPRTFADWLRKRPTRVGRDGARRKRGRPRTAAEIRRLILRIARQTGWGFTKILGELRKLGVRKVSRSTVINLLHEQGVPSAPERGEGTWAEFLKAHAKTLWACDFISKRIWTPRGLRFAFVLVFIHVKSRKVHASRATLAPDPTWTANEVEVFRETVRRAGERPRHLIRDRDGKFGAGFEEEVRDSGVRSIVLPHRAPNLNAHAEHFIQTLERECLDKFVVLGLKHLDHLVSEFVEHYNQERPHSGIGYRTPCGPAPPEDLEPAQLGEVGCRERLGGALKHYFRRAA